MPHAFVRPCLVLALLVGLFAPASARADPLFAPEPDVDPDAVERYEAGANGSAWFSLSAFAQSSRSHDADRAADAFGGMATLGVSFDGPSPRMAIAPAGRPLASLGIAPRGALHLPLTRSLARAAVAAAWRAAGVDASDDRLDGLSARARWSALLPEVRTRAARLFDESARIDSTSTGDPKTSDSARANLWLEARLTWRLDRLLFAGVEPAVERMRFERSDARARIAARVLKLLGAWQKAWLEACLAPADSPDALEAVLRFSESEASLDVMTGGWFGRWRATPEGARALPTPPPPPEATP